MSSSFGNCVLSMVLLALAVVWSGASTHGGARAAGQATAEPVQGLIGSWTSTDRNKISTKIFRADGTFTEVRRLLGASATITGIYRLQGRELWWIARKLTIDRAGGDVLPPTADVRLDQEQKVIISWKGADAFMILGEPSILYQRVRQ